MNNNLNLFKDIENQLAVEKIKYNGVYIWQFLRLLYRQKFTYTTISEDNSNNKKFILNINFLLQIIKKSVKGFGNYHLEKKYLLFTNLSNEKEIDGKISDKFGHPIIKNFNKDLLVFLIPYKFKFKNTPQYYYSNFISTWVLYVLCLPSIIFRLLVGVKIENEDLLVEIEKKLDININYKFKTILFIAFYNKLLKYFRKNKKIKAVFIECYMGLMHQSAIMAAKKCGIKTIEIQHGIISKAHTAYIVPQKISRDTFPDYFFAFGKYVKNILNDSFINNEHIIPVGNYYLEYLRNNKELLKGPKIYCNKLRDSYEKIIAVTSQSPIENELIDFINKAADKLHSTAIIFIPRIYNKKYCDINFHKNIFIHEEYGFYELVSFCDIHSTVYSTCALEAPFLGIPNIFININNLSKYHFLEIFNNNFIYNYCDDVDSFVNLVNNWKALPTEEVINLSSELYESNSEEKIMKAIENIL